MAKQFREMLMSDLGAVMQLEPMLYRHPWTYGNFVDSLNNHHQAWVLSENEVIIGYSVMMMVLDEAHLLNISVDIQMQGKGWGRYLLDLMMKKARELGAANLFLEVRVSNVNAIKLYEKVGFNEMAIRRNYYPAVAGREDAILMGIAL